MPKIRVLTWNLNSCSRAQRTDKARLLLELPWDVAMLQECDELTVGLVASAGGADDVLSALGTGVPSSVQRNAHGCALAVRGGTIRNPQPGRQLPMTRPIRSCHFLRGASPPR